MSMLINVVGQKMSISTPKNKFAPGSQQFVKFQFNLSDEWNGLMTFAQFRQNDIAYNQYLDENNCVFLPREIQTGNCTLMLYGSRDEVIATTNYITLWLNEDVFVSNAQSTDISESLYNQLVASVERGRIIKMEQTKTSTEDGGENIWTATFGDGHSENFIVRNGTKGNMPQKGIDYLTPEDIKELNIATRLTGDYKPGNVLVVDNYGNMSDSGISILDTIESWADVQQIVRDGNASKRFKVGNQLVCTKNGKEIVWDVVGFDQFKPLDDKYEHSMTLQVHESYRMMAKFERPRAEFYFPHSLPNGTYCYYNDSYKCYLCFTADIPAGSLICKAGDSVCLLMSNNSTITSSNRISTTASETPQGTDITSYRINAEDEQYDISSVRSYLNLDTYGSRAPLFHIGSTKLDWHTEYGFLRNLDSDFKAVIGRVDLSDVVIETPDAAERNFIENYPGDTYTNIGLSKSLENCYMESGTETDCAALALSQNKAIMTGHYLLSGLSDYIVKAEVRIDNSVEYNNSLSFVGIAGRTVGQSGYELALMYDKRTAKGHIRLYDRINKCAIFDNMKKGIDVGVYHELCMEFHKDSLVCKVDGEVVCTATVPTDVIGSPAIISGAGQAYMRKFGVSLLPYSTLIKDYKDLFFLPSPEFVSKDTLYYQNGGYTKGSFCWHTSKRGTAVLDSDGTIGAFYVDASIAPMCCVV